MTAHKACGRKKGVHVKSKPGDGVRMSAAVALFLTGAISIVGLTRCDGRGGAGSGDPSVDSPSSHSGGGSGSHGGSGYYYGGSSGSSGGDSSAGNSGSVSRGGFGSSSHSASS